MKHFISHYGFKLILGLLLITVLVMVGAPYFKAYEWYETLSYGEHPSQTLEIAVPKSHLDTPTPAIIYIHGGGWAAGDKSNYRHLRDATIAKGYRYVSINYRLVGEGVTYEEMLIDIDWAIDFLHFNANTYGIDTHRTVLVGGSAGAHLSLLYSYTQTPIIPIQFVMAYVPPVDFMDPQLFEMVNRDAIVGMINGVTGTDIDDATDIEAGYPDAWIEASPITHVATAIPTLIGYGGVDELIPATNVPLLVSAWTREGVPIETIFFPTSGHNLSNDPEQSTLLATIFQEWLNVYLPVTLDE